MNVCYGINNGTQRQLNQIVSNKIILNLFLQHAFICIRLSDRPISGLNTNEPINQVC